MGDDKRRNPWGNDNRSGDDRRGQNPWGNGGNNNNRGGGNEPDLDEILRKAQENLKDFMPGNFQGGKLAGLIILAIIALWLASGFYIVSPGEHGVVQRFGAWNHTETTEGLKYHMPFPIDTVQLVKVNEIRRMNVGFTEMVSRSGSNSRTTDIPDESLMLTADRNIVDLDMVIQWNIKSAEDFLFQIEEPEDTIKKVAESAIREVVGQTDMFPIITTGRTAVANRTREIIQQNLDEYHAGVNVTQVLIQQAEVHPDVQAAFQDVQSAKQDADDAQNRAQAYREGIVPIARGEAIKLVQEAEAYEQSVTARATGDADRFNAVLQAYQQGKDVTKKRIYIETMEEVLKNAQKIILDENGQGSGVVPYLPLNELRPAAGNASSNRKDAE